MTPTQVARIHADLRRIDQALLAAIDTLDLLYRCDEPPSRSALAEARLEVGRITARRSRLLDEEVRPAVAHLLNEAMREAVRDLEEKGAAMRAAASDHIGRWSSDAAVADWVAYRAAAAPIAARLRERLEAERALIYALLLRGAG